MQQQLKKNGHSHSQDTISEEYLQPLLNVGLATEARDEYYATAFGCRLTELLGCFPEFAEKLPAHSECYEESLLQSLLSGPKTFEEIEGLISPKIASRILKRLRSSGLVRRQQKEITFSSLSQNATQTKKPSQPESIKFMNRLARRNLCRKTGERNRSFHEKNLQVSRGLKGKKLVFIRRNPKAYALTTKGKKLASVLQELQDIVEDTWNSSERVMQNNANS